MMDKQKGDFVFECDNCGAALETDQADFDVARSILRREGWRARKIGDVWQHGCASCGVPGKRAQLALGGTGQTAVSKDIPIIFSAPMVRALLEGRKTMTRRILKPQPVPFMIDDKLCDVTLMQIDGDKRPRVTLGRVITKQEVRFAPGDRLWVREAWALHSLATDFCSVVYRASINGAWSEAHEMIPVCKLAGKKLQPKPFQEGWRSPLHLFREMSRLTLIVTGVKVERVQDISETDAKAEGAIRALYSEDTGGYLETGHGTYQCGFSGLWCSLHGADSWDQNPFVVASTFRVIKANIDAPEARIAA